MSAGLLDKTIGSCMRTNGWSVLGSRAMSCTTLTPHSPGSGTAPNTTPGLVFPSRSRQQGLVRDRSKCEIFDSPSPLEVYPGHSRVGGPIMSEEEP